MKKFLLVVCVCVFAGSFSYAQDIKFGAKAGLNLSTIVGDDIDNADMKAGLYFGGFMNVSLNDRLSFQPELLYSVQGAKDEYKEEDFSYEETMKLSYLNIPLLLKMSLGASNRVHIYAGPQLGFLLDAESDYEEVDYSGSYSGTEDIKDYINSFEFSLNLGLSFNVSDNLSLDVRYNRGLSNIYDNDGDEDIKAYNSGFQLGAAYTF